MYELFDHTADVGLRIRGRSRSELFSEAGRGLLALLVENPEAVLATHEATFRLEERDASFLLLDWLHELLYAFETRRLLLVEFDVALDEPGLAATARGEPYDDRRHRLDHEVKAITYHGLAVRQTADGWEAEVIVDV